MLQLSVYFFLFLSIISIVINPWVPALFYFLNGIMQPSFVWPWSFPSFSFMSMSKILAIFTILAWMKLLVTKKIDFNVYKNPQHFAIAAMWILMHLSDVLSPFPVYYAGVKAHIILAAMDTIVIMYFVGIGILSNVDDYKKSFLWLSVMFAYIAVYYVYWANDLYLDNRWDMFTQGRLNSPRGTTIGDQNALSCLIAMGMPFIFLGFFYLKNFFLRWSCLAVLPLLWHALFLFGSRGAMLALLCTTLLCLLLLKPYKKTIKKSPVNKFSKFNNHVNKTKPLQNNQQKNKLSHELSLEEIKKNAEEQTQKIKQAERFKSLKLFKIIILVGLAGAIITQGGSMLSRSSSTIAEAKSEEREAPLNPRLVSWQVGKQLIIKYPLLGVGSQRFQMASNQLFPGKSTHVAHNTFINFSANTGLPVGLLFLLLFWFNYKNYKYCRINGIEKYPLLEYVNIASASALVAFFISALFLDMIIFEAFYFILMLNVAKLFIFKKLLKLDNGDLIEKSKPQINRKYY